MLDYIYSITNFCVYRDPDTVHTVTNAAYNIVNRTNGAANEADYDTIPNIILSPSTAPTTQL